MFGEGKTEALQIQLVSLQLLLPTGNHPDPIENEICRKYAHRINHDNNFVLRIYILPQHWNEGLKSERNSVQLNLIRLLIFGWLMAR